MSKIEDIIFMSMLIGVLIGVLRVDYLSLKDINLTSVDHDFITKRNNNRLDYMSNLWGDFQKKYGFEIKYNDYDYSEKKDMLINQEKYYKYLELMQGSIMYAAQREGSQAFKDAKEIVLKNTKPYSDKHFNLRTNYIFLTALVLNYDTDEEKLRFLENTFIVF